MIQNRRHQQQQFFLVYVQTEKPRDQLQSKKKETTKDYKQNKNLFI
jgi:hypothetical protein